MGGGGASLPEVDALQLNPASVSSSGFTAGISYANRFLLKELVAGDAQLIVPIAGSSVFAQFGQFGNRAFRENHVGIGLARKFGNHFSGGVQFHYFQLLMAENGRKPGLSTFSLGLNFTNADYGFGLSVFNPISQKMTSSDFTREYPFVGRLGAHKAFGDHFLVVSQLTYEDVRKITAHIGLQIFVLDRFCIRAGVQSSSPSWSMGLGFLFAKVQTDLAFSYHEYLGFSPSVSLYLKQR
ncbi:PorV/PorQ family protein [Mangrovibacterium diazotrophicum]|uniref:Type IX secretion system PorP/SprF family membrane protein n=1 Tax=Mangrovibacterium diazotrophicum TaxID=1261403 RepID=A0A419VVN5_9BACT|nr:hypothetical protein [Mangrovibacterium diazotrophicum]RKD86193.1 hypothetical protein BC643_4510 [Mangrovibacterium diazotrophicum]